MYYIVDRNSKKILCRCKYKGNVSFDYSLISFFQLRDFHDISYEYDTLPFIDEIIDESKSDLSEYDIDLVVVDGMNKLKKILITK
jgi:hypothetical protein